VSGETSNLVTETLGLDHGDVVDDSLVGVEVIGKPAIKRTTELAIQSICDNQVSLE
jgi:hypothetical protein